jgi:hypothetical protein
VDLMAAPDSRKFQVRCDAGSPGRFEVGTDTLSARVEAKTIAAIHSRPQASDVAAPSLRCDFKLSEPG